MEVAEDENGKFVAVYREFDKNNVEITTMSKVARDTYTEAEADVLHGMKLLAEAGLFPRPKGSS